MQALTVIPGTPNSARLIAAEDPPRSDGALLVRTLALGICGTDIEIISGRYGWAPPGQERLILGHEVLGRVVEAPDGGAFETGDLIAGIVRRPDPVPCVYCAAGEWDMCRNGRYTERGIKERHGYGSEMFRVEPEFAIRLDPDIGLPGVLVEPASVVAKAWDHAERIGRRSSAWAPRSVLVTGAGPIGLLAALMGAQRGLEVHVFDRVHTGPKPALVRDLGGTYHAGKLPSLTDLSPDLVFECTGAASVIADVVTRNARSGIVCLAGVSSGNHLINLDLGTVNRRMVLENDVVFGSVNANRCHYEAAAAALASARREWLDCLLQRQVPLARWEDALHREENDVKTVITFPAP